MTEASVSASDGALEDIKVARPDHWLKNIFILFGHAVAVGTVVTIAAAAVLTTLPADLTSYFHSFKLIGDR